MLSRLKTDLHIRTTRRDMLRWRRAARREGKTLSDWIRALLNLASVPARPALPPVVSGEQVELPLGGQR